MSEWSEYKLEEIAQLEKDSWKVEDEELPYIALEHIVEGGLRLQGIGDSNTIASNKFRFNSDCFLFGKLRPYFFRQWFVEKAKEDWKEVTLYDAIELIGGGTPKTSITEYWNGNIKWLSGGDIASNHKSVITSSEKSITEDGLNNSSAKLLPKYSTVISARETVGKYCILSEPMAFSQSNYGIKPKFKDCYFFTYSLINHSVEELQSAAYGSVFDTITTETFKGYDVKLPIESEIRAFELNVTPYFLKILNNQNQIRILEKIRDTLLPKLMSGEVKLKHIKMENKI